MKITEIEAITLKLPGIRRGHSQRTYEHLMRAWELFGAVGEGHTYRQWTMSDTGYQDTLALHEAQYEAFLREDSIRDAGFTTVYRMHTDEGLIGLSDSPPSDPERFLGRSPFEFIGDDSAGAFQMALYDLMGKATGQPAAKLIGPIVRRKVLVSYWSHCFPPEVLLSETKRAVELGFMDHKIKRRPHYNILDQLEVMSEVIPEGYRITIDSNATLRIPDRVIALASELDRFPNVYALEEPIPQDNIAGYRRLRAKLPYPIIVDRPELGGTGYFQAIVNEMCDGMKIGMYGVEHCRRLSALAEEGGHIPVYMEGGGLLGSIFSVHVAATIRNATLAHPLSVYLDDNHLISNLMKIKDGYVDLPQGPGLGVELDEDAIEKYRVE